ncbi:hypothetical protein COH37_12950, partial [Neisseria meningitidis]
HAPRLSIISSPVFFFLAPAIHVLCTVRGVGGVRCVSATARCPMPIEIPHANKKVPKIGTKTDNFQHC